MVDATIRVVDRGELKLDENWNLEAHTVATRSNKNPDHDWVSFPSHCVVIEHPEGTILYDTGPHPEAMEGRWPEELCELFPAQNPNSLEEDLDSVGYEIDDIDYVIVSHLHIDHCGELRHFDGTDVPVFVNEEEMKHAWFHGKVGPELAYVPADFDHDLNWQFLTLEVEHPFEDVELIHVPGHTPGDTALLVHTDKHGSILFASDLIHVQENWDDERPLGGPVVWNRQAWFDSVARLKDIARQYDPEVVCAHDRNQMEEIQPGWL